MENEGIAPDPANEPQTPNADDPRPPAEGPQSLREAAVLESAEPESMVVVQPSLDDAFGVLDDLITSSVDDEARRGRALRKLQSCKDICLGNA